MCALIAMAVYDTEENKRTELTRRTIESLLNTVDFNKDRLIISDNNSCKATKELYIKLSERFEKFPVGQGMVIYNDTNLGTAEAINKAWKHRKPGEHAVKMDNDVVIHFNGWVNELEAAIEREPYIGIIGLKRKDCWENPEHPNLDFKSQLIMLPQDGSGKWIVVEQVRHVIGTCQMYSSALLDKIGYLFQPSLYGYDDVLASHRSHFAGFYNCFLPHIEIDHIDAGVLDYQKWKEQHASENGQETIRIFREYESGARPIYYEPKD